MWDAEPLVAGGEGGLEPLEMRPRFRGLRSSAIGSHDQPQGPHLRWLSRREVRKMLELTIIIASSGGIGIGPALRRS